MNGFDVKRIILSVMLLTLVITAGCSWQGTMGNVKDRIKQEQIKKANGQEAGIPVLMYHHLLPDLTGHEGNEAIVTVDQFREQMEYLAQEGFTTLTTDQLLGYLEGEGVPDKSIVITFDDGYESNYNYAYPILKEYNLHAIIHVIVAVTPGEAGGDRVGIPKVSWEQMQEMTQSGAIDIQSHTYDSHYFAPVDDAGENEKPVLTYQLWLPEENRLETEREYVERITKDLRLSKEMIEERLGNEVTVLAYPFGKTSDQVRQIARDELDLKLGFVITPGYVKPGDNPLLVKRINVSPQWELEDFTQVVNGEKEW